MIGSSTSRRQRRAGRLLDDHGPHLLALAGTLTATSARAERLVIDAVAAQVHHRTRGSRRTRCDLSRHLHSRWLSTHGPRGDQAVASGPRGRAHELSDLQLGLLALVLFSGCTCARVGHTLRLSPHESATTLRDALRSVAS
ncbi:hypothetical protein [Aeromicrobium sp. CF3.5]|uniref:hypothetical protein n=1 Tax=Aeromicrobium sp. CF3.5 TaxID=3373078 RepID=UPI003EE50BB6